jgi:hypothetical protein
MIPRKKDIFLDSIIYPDKKLGTNAKCIAFEKISEDNRNWNYYENF